MKIIVIGAGKVGATLIDGLVKEGHDVIAIDKNADVISDIVNRVDANGFVGGGLEREVLDEAGVSGADFVIACTTNDEVNILCAVLSKKMGAKKTIARVRDPQYFRDLESIKKELGLDLAFNPELRTASDISEVLNFPSAVAVEGFAGGKARMAEFNITENNPIVGKTIMEIIKEYGNVLFGAVSRGEKSFVPRGDFVIENGDVIYVIGTQNGIAGFCKKTNIFKPRAKNVLIVGGGRIAFYLAKDLSSEGVNVKILESDKARCEELSALLSNAEVVFGDGTDQSVLDEVGLKNSDALVSLTGMDEENVIISLYAKLSEVDKVVTKVDRPSIGSMVTVLGLDSVVSPRISIANHIIRYIRATIAESSEKINTLYKLENGVEVTEFTVSNAFEGLNTPIRELKIVKDVLIGGIVRKDEFILPVGDTIINEGDKIIIVSLNKGIMELGEILK